MEALEALYDLLESFGSLTRHLSVGQGDKIFIALTHSMPWFALMMNTFECVYIFSHQNIKCLVGIISYVSYCENKEKG